MKRLASFRGTAWLALSAATLLGACGGKDQGGDGASTGGRPGSTSGGAGDANTTKALGGGESIASKGGASSFGGGGMAAAVAGAPTGISGGAGLPGGTSFAGGASLAGNTSVSAPSPQNSIIVQSPSGIVDKMDILFAVDNSLSMSDKQQVLATAVPQLLRRLTNPDCISLTAGSNVESVQMADPSLECPAGTVREFAPIKDIHVGVVTSSLGDFGGDVCPEEGGVNAAQNDHAWLTGALRRTQGTLPPFLNWTATDAAAYVTSIGPKLSEFANLVAAATELGCGNEMVLESWYRFLIDPKPPADILMVNSGPNQRGPIDQSILEQRKAFLRPDSLVAVVMLTDDDDCSMRDDTYSWVYMRQSGGLRMWRGSSVCATNPNDRCCFSCMLSANASAECKAKDPGCEMTDASAKLPAAEDDVNMRCRDMKKRFGVDMLFPATRYVNALSKLELCPEQSYGDLDCDCTEAKRQGLPCNPGQAVPNRLFQNLNPEYVPTGPVRLDASSVFLAGIVGVPWQDLAVDEALVGNTQLKYRLGSQLDWDLFAPKDAQTLPLDPLMTESSAPRIGIHPITKEPLAGPEATPMANRINGHEWYTADKDVQYACIFGLDQPIAPEQSTGIKLCDLEAACGPVADTDEYRICARRMDGCSCIMTPPERAELSTFDPRVSHTPLCQAPDGSYSATQRYAKAYPSLRELQVLRGFHQSSPYSQDNAIVASICPKDLNYANALKPGYGYNPAMRALVDRLKDNVGGTCLSAALVADADTGRVPCALIEAITPQGAAEGSCDCTAKQRDTISPEKQQSMRALLESRGTCSGQDCDKFCFCQLRQLLPGTAAGDACLNNIVAAKTTNPPGFCYVEPPKHGNPALVADCTSDKKRTIRIVGDDAHGLAAPAKGPVFYTCEGSPFVASATSLP